MIATVIGIGFNSAPIAMDSNGCFLFESHFDFSVPDTVLNRLLVHCNTITECQLILNRPHYEKYENYLDCISIQQRDGWIPTIYCIKPADYEHKPKYNIIRAKLCEKGAP